MPRVTTEFATDDADVRKGMDRLIRDFTKLREENAKLKRESREAARQFKRQTEDNAQAQGKLNTAGKAFNATLGVMSGLVGGVTVAVGSAKLAWNQWRQEMDAVGEAGKKAAGTIIKEISDAGLASRGPQTLEFIRGLVGAPDMETNRAGVTREQAMAAFSGVVSGGNTLDSAMQESLTRSIAKAAPFKAAGDLQQLGLLAGKLQELDLGKASSDVADLALKLQAEAGDKIGQLQQDTIIKGVGMMSRSGFSVEEGLGLARLAQERGFTPELLVNIASKVTDRDLKPRAARRGQPGVEADAAFNRFVGEQDFRKRLELLLDDPRMARAVLGGEIGAKVGDLGGFTSFLGQRAKLVLAQRDDFAESNLQNLLKTDPQFFMEQMEEAKRSREDLDVEFAQRMRLLGRSQFNRRNRRRGPFMAFVGTVAREMDEFTEDSFGFHGGPRGRDISTQVPELNPDLVDVSRPPPRGKSIYELLEEQNDLLRSGLPGSPIRAAGWRFGDSTE